MAEARLGIISDTHGLLRQEAIDALAGAEHIVHAGDVGDAMVLERLRELAPLTVVRGNIDVGRWAAALPATEMLAAAGLTLYVIHDLKELSLDPAAAGIDVVVSGHTHKPSVERRGGVLFINPGSAGRRRFSLPVTLALLDVGEAGMRIRLVDLETGEESQWTLPMGVPE